MSDSSASFYTNKISSIIQKHKRQKAIDDAVRNVMNDDTKCWTLSMQCMLEFGPTEAERRYPITIRRIRAEFTKIMQEGL